MDDLEIRRSVKEATVKVSDIRFDDIGDSASFVDDLGLDSLALLEISVEICLRYRLNIPEEQLTKIRTIEDAVQLVHTSLAKQNQHDPV
jgi:acyl carrier protein